MLAVVFTTRQPFLGLIRYYSSFLLSLHEVRGPLTSLLRKGTPWNWSAHCLSAFEKLKSMPNSDMLLTYYNPKLSIIVAADTSNYGMGTVQTHIFPNGSEKAVAQA